MWLCKCCVVCIKMQAKNFVVEEGVRRDMVLGVRTTVDIFFMEGRKYHHHYVCIIIIWKQNSVNDMGDFGGTTCMTRLNKSKNLQLHCLTEHFGHWKPLFQHHFSHQPCWTGILHHFAIAWPMVRRSHSILKTGIFVWKTQRVHKVINLQSNNLQLCNTIILPQVGWTCHSPL